MDEDKKIISYAAAYAVLGFLTFGFTYNELAPLRDVDCGPRPNSVMEPVKYEEWAKCDVKRFQHRDPRPAAAAAGLLWPLYLGGRAAIFVTSRSLIAKEYSVGR